MNLTTRSPRSPRARGAVRSSLGVFAATLLIFGLAACQGQTEPPPRDATAPEESAKETPERIASLNYESTEILAELGLHDRIVLMPEAVLNEALGSHQEELYAVQSTYAVEKELTVEAVLDTEPDLVVMSPRHGAEHSIGRVLAEAGVETLMTPNAWGTPTELVDNVRLIGEAVGAADEAEALAAELESGLQADTSAVRDDPPRILVLTNQAGKPFMTAGQAFPLELVTLAGGASVSDELGVTTTGPIQVEQIIEADPDGILLIDMNGSGDRLFSDVLTNEAVAQLPAVAEERMLRVKGKEVQALGLTNTIDGLERLQEWIATL